MDLSFFILLEYRIERRKDPVRNIADAHCAVDGNEKTFFAIEVDKREGSVIVDFEPGAAYSPDYHPAV